MNIGKVSNKNINKILNWGLLAIVVLFDVALVLVSFGVHSYSGFSKSLFTIIYIGMVLLVLIVNTFGIIAIFKKELWVKIVGLSLTFLLTLAVGFGYYAIVRVNNDVQQIVNTEKTITESLSVSFVTYNNNLIIEEKDIEGSKFGIVGNESFQEGNILAKQELEAKNINVNFVEFDNYNNLLLGLFNGECDVASLPSNYVSLFSQEEGYEEYLANTKVIYTFDKVVEVDNITNNNLDVTSDPFTILAIGIDEGRSDSLILMSVNPKTMTLTMTSIARDTYVPIACYSGGGRDKINHARSVSRQCTIDTIEQWLGVDINFYVETNFKGVVDIVNALGGLEVTSPISFVAQDSSSERGHYTIFVPEGTNFLNGEQVLAFARERYQMPNGDYDRQVHQQQVIANLIESVISIRDVNVMLDVLDAAGENVSTNMSVNQMTALANYVFKVADNTAVEPTSIVRIKNSRITGYASYYYNYSSALPLWIMLPYNGAIKDAQNLIAENLILPENKVLKAPEQFSASVLYYDDPIYYQEEYAEAIEVIEMPDFMPNMKFKYNVDQARAWCNERGISFQAIGVNEGDAEYVAGYAQGTVVAQSVPYATLTENISSVTVWVIGETFNIPELTGYSYTDMVNWCNANGYNCSITWITSNDQGYDSYKAGQIAKQSVNTEQKSVSISVYDYPAITTPFPGVGASKDDVDRWSSQTGVQVNYTGRSGRVSSYSVTNYTGESSNTIKQNSVVNVVLAEAQTPTFTVTFVNGVTNQVISSVEVKQGESVSLPEAPAVEGYTFTGWNGTYQNINSNQTVVAEYKKNETSDPGTNPDPSEGGEEENPPENTQQG